MKSSGAAWRAKLTEKPDSMGYRYTDSDPYVCIKSWTTENGAAYYNYMLVYVDDVLHLSKDAQEDMFKLNRFNDWRKVLGHQIDISGTTSIKFNYRMEEQFGLWLGLNICVEL